MDNGHARGQKPKEPQSFWGKIVLGLIMIFLLTLTAVISFAPGSPFHTSDGPSAALSQESIMNSQQPAGSAEMQADRKLVKNSSMSKNSKPRPGKPPAYAKKPGAGATRKHGPGH